MRRFGLDIITNKGNIAINTVDTADIKVLCFFLRLFYGDYDIDGASIWSGVGIYASTHIYFGKGVHVWHI